MGLLVSPTEADMFTVLRTFLLEILPTATEVFQGQDNKVPEPTGDNFVVMTPIHRHRLSTNIDKWMDCAFAATILNDQLTVTAVAIGKIVTPAQIFSPSFDLNVPVFILSQISGSPPGGAGVYQLSSAPDVGDHSQVGLFVIGDSPIEGTKFASGQAAMLQPTEVTVQLDVHGPISADNSQIITTAFQDLWAFDYFARLNANISPLYANDPMQLPFENEEQQTENRWVIEAFLQVNATVAAPQQYADRIDLGLINVDATYPP